VGGEYLDYPGDDKGSPEQTINCHCIAVALPPEQTGIGLSLGAQRHTPGGVDHDQDTHGGEGGGDIYEGMTDGQASLKEGLDVFKIEKKAKIYSRRDVTRPSGRPAIAIWGPADEQTLEGAMRHTWSYYQKSTTFDVSADPPKSWRDEILIDQAHAEWLGMPTDKDEFTFGEILNLKKQIEQDKPND
jgi:hypothetical protein